MTKEAAVRSWDLWEQLVQSHSRFGMAGRAFLAPGVDRVGVLKDVLSHGVDPTAVQMLESLPKVDLQALFPVLLRFVSYSHGAIDSFQRAILLLDRDWLVPQMRDAMPAILSTGGDDEYRRIMELCYEVDSALCREVASEAIRHADPHIREAGEDFLAKCSP